jgi:hypothetical protein
MHTLYCDVPVIWSCSGLKDAETLIDWAKSAVRDRLNHYIMLPLFLLPIMQMFCRLYMLPHPVENFLALHALTCSC